MPIISEEKREANRANAQKSTGPKSAAGRLASRFNALKHGLCAEQTVLPGEDAQEFTALAHEMLARFKPVGRAERALVDRAALMLWRLRRAGLAEAACLAAQARLLAIEPGDGRPEPAEEMAALGAAFTVDFDGARMVERLAGYETRIERSLEKALKLLERVRAERPAHVPAWREPSQPEAEPELTEAEMEEMARRSLERGEREDREAREQQQGRPAHPQGWLSRAVAWLEKPRFPAAFGFVLQNRWRPAAA